MYTMNHIDQIIINFDGNYSDNEEPIEETLRNIEIESEGESWTIFVD